MRLLHSPSSRAVLLIAGLCLALAGCATKNPLMDDAPLAKTTAATPVKAASAAAPDAATGTQTSGPTGIRRVLGVFSPYKIDIQQGNFVSREMISQLREGMTRDQVRFVLGTPMLSDIFHADRWHYPFQIQKGNGEITASRVAVYFKDDLLERFEGGDLPTEQDYISRIAGGAPDDTTAPAAAAIK
ncbi:outer membrane protein assembly factor BamE [Herminiimonas sp. CN]|uniref:outer membrane protein assembly factor BamE n=1 Tax=Herminiimonas sp. CN TaxID=1349818 RepID=UPI0006888455|nr:outer membrane protein assembly factor BamE [Herminiimonas sp. CN]